MAAPRESLGGVPCLCCGEQVPVKKSAGGAVSVCCPWCDLSAYAKEGTEAYRRIIGKLPKPAAPNIPQQPPEAVPVPSPIPLPPSVKQKPKNPLFPMM